MTKRKIWRRLRWLGLALVSGVLADGVGVESTSESREPLMEERGFEETAVFDFGSAAEVWPNIDDPVMGGLSRSTMSIDGGSAVFAGVVSLENNGGFASLRSRSAEHDLQGFEGVVLRVFGDGKTYGVRLRTDAAFDGVSYQAPLATEAGRWSEVRLPFRIFRPVFRGREVLGHPALDPGAIKTFGLIIAGRQEGPFRLEIDWIKAYRDRRGD